MANFDVLMKDYSSEEMVLLVEAFVEDLSFWVSSPSKSQEKKKIIERLTNEETKRRMALNGRRGKRSTQGRSKEQQPDQSESPPLTEHKQEPSNWRTAVDPMSGKIYYYDTITRRTQWEKPEEVKAFEKNQKREFRRKQKAFFKEMEANLTDSLARGEVMPGVPRENVEKAGPPKEPILITAPRTKVRTISCMNEELLAELQNGNGEESEIPFPLVNLSVGNVAMGDGRSNGRQPAPGPPLAPLEGRPPLPHRRSVSSVPQQHELEWQPPNSSDDVFPQLDSMELSPEPGEFRKNVTESPSSVDNDLLEGEHLLDEQIFDENKSKNGTVNTNTTEQIPPQNAISALARPSTMKLHNRRNTGGTIFVKSTMENPDIEATIKCICGIFRVHIIEASSQLKQNKLHDTPPYQQRIDVNIFRDDYAGSPPYGNKHYQKLSSCGSTASVPSLAEIESFYKRFYERSQMEHDTLIMSLIYVERLIKETDGRVAPMPETWESILFSCMVLASKVWDDLSMWNVDFSNVSMSSSSKSQFSLKRINQLEFAVLACLNFNVKVKASEYAKYYYYIREMLTKSGLIEHADSPLKKQEMSFLGSPKNQTTPIARPERNRARSFDLNCLGPQKEQIGPDSVCLEQLLISLNR